MDDRTAAVGGTRSSPTTTGKKNTGGYASAERELEDLRPAYEQTLDALRHQQLVIEQLQNILMYKLQAGPLCVDECVQTEPMEEVPESLFVGTLRLKLELDRVRMQRVHCSKAQEVELSVMEKDLLSLREQVALMLPPGVHTQPLLEAQLAAIRNNEAPPDPFGAIRMTSKT